MGKRKISVVITDLDNTLYDWFDVWSRSFGTMLNSLAEQSGVPTETLIAEIKTIHEKHGTSEYAFLINEIPSLRSKHAGGDLTAIYAPAIKAYEEQRAAHLSLYPDVLDTLQKLKDTGCLVVGYTESQLLYTDFRVRALGLDGLIDFLYSPPTHEMPPDPASGQGGFYPAISEKLQSTVHRATPKDKEKPSPEVLESIIADIGIKKDSIIYVGDSPIKDITMAQDAQVADVYAAYGHVDKEGGPYQLLRKVTHWKPTSVQREKSEADVRPTFTLYKSFKELLDLFDFIPFLGGGNISDARLDSYIEVWKKTIDVQQHFNDLELRIRNFAITVLGVVLSGTALSIKEGLAVYVFSYPIPLAALLILIALVTWWAFYVMDFHWYHNLLIGAVKHGEKLETSIKGVLPDIDLTRSISDASPAKILGKVRNSREKMKMFYGSVAILLGIVFLVLLFTPPPKKQPDAETGVTINNVTPAAAKPEAPPASGNSNAAPATGGGSAQGAGVDAGRNGNQRNDNQRNANQ